MPVCSTLKDENGNVVMWQIRHITTEENEDIRQECMEEKGGKYRLNVNKYLSKITAMSVVYPNLYDADLQDSYGKNSGITFKGYCRLPRRIRFSCILCSGYKRFYKS